MVQRVPAEEFLQLARTVPVIDVRAPAEFARGHMPGAISMPLFDDEERAAVGIMYNRQGRAEAIEKGLEIFGPKMAGFVSRVRDAAPGGKILVYCWRGGMRSDSIAWLLGTSGFEAVVLEKGYKGYRAYIHDAFERAQPMAVIGGMTGSGKTELLELLQERQLQVIDLEGLAHHKGSVFGSLGMPEQPTNEQFENDLGHKWLELSKDRLVCLEDESIGIGRNSIPKPLFDQMQQAPLIFIDMPMEARVERLFREYAHFSPAFLKPMISKVSRRLGGEHTQAAIRAVDNGQLRDAIRIVLRYYDKAYAHEAGKREKEKIVYITAEDEHVEKLLPALLGLTSAMNP